MGAEIARRISPLQQDLEWARAVAQADIVPAAYKARPSNLIVAAQLGRALGIHPMIAVNQIYVVDGKPSTSALLIGALVRKAGHKLRITADNSSATVVIIRHDDPDFEYKVTWRLKKGNHNDPSAEQAGLLRKDNWVKYSAAMLPSRALTACARMACGEALLGVAHTTEELNPDIATDEHGGAIKAERISFEDMYAEYIRNSTTTEELKRWHKEASVAGVLKVVPTGEERTVLKMLNDKMRELKAKLPPEENEDAGGTERQSRSEQPETMAAQTTDGSEPDQNQKAEEEYLNPPATDKDNPAFARLDEDGAIDAEIVDDDGMGNSSV